MLGYDCTTAWDNSSASSRNCWSMSPCSVCRNPSRTPSSAPPTVSSTTAVFHTVNRNRKERKAPLRCPNGIASSSHRLDQRVLKFPFQFVAQAVDVYLDDVGGAFPVGVPKVFAEHLAGDHLPGVPHQQLEQAELGGSEIDLFFTAMHAAGGQIEGEIADFQHGRRPIDGATANRLDAGHQFGEGEGFDHIIVGARLEPRHTLFDR